MIVININKKQYRVKTEWEDITLKQAQQLNELQKPKQLLNVYNATTQEQFDKALKALKRSDNITYFKQAIELLGGVPMEILEATNTGIEDFYFKHLEKLVVGMHNMYPHSYEFRKIKSFDFKGKTYQMPSEETILNDTKPLAKEKTAAFIEGMELMSAIQNKVMKEQGLAGLTAVFARPDGDEFTEAGAIERAGLFTDLTMDNHWEVFFCLMDLLKRCVEISNTYLEEAAKVK